MNVSFQWNKVILIREVASFTIILDMSYSISVSLVL